MSSFHKCLNTEAIGNKIVYDWISDKHPDWTQFWHTDGGEWSMTIQYEMGGDFTLRRPGKKDILCEVKTEEKFTENIFPERWSNRSTGRDGWLITSRATLLFYLFLDRRIMYLIDMEKLQEWHKSGDMDRFRMAKQEKHIQHNDTRGLIVPIDDARERGVIHFDVDISDYCEMKAAA